MTTIRKRLPSPAILLALVALVFAGVGTAVAGPDFLKVKKSTVKKIAKKQAKKESKKALKQNVDGSHVNLADSATNATTADTAKSLSTILSYSKDTPENTLVSLAKSGNYELLGDCDANGDFAIPAGAAGATLEYNASQTLSSTTLILVNRGADPVFADTDDDADYKLETDEGVAFNYQDNGDGGALMGTDGTYFLSPGWGGIESDSSFVDSPNADDDTVFGSDCHFAGLAIVG